MTNNFEIFINGRKIEFPFDIDEMFSQLGLQEVTPQPVMPIIHPQHSIVRKIITCKDIAVREVVIEMNKRIMKIEELLKIRKKTPAKKVISKTKGKTKVKEIPKKKLKVEGKPKNSKGIKKKIGKKK